MQAAVIPSLKFMILSFQLNMQFVNEAGKVIKEDRRLIPGPVCVETASKLPEIVGVGTPGPVGSSVPLFINQPVAPPPVGVLVQPVILPDSKPPLVIKLTGAPLPNDGVTVTVATTGAVVAFVAVKLAILPVPLAARPMEGVLFTQLNTVPGGVVTEPLKLTAAVGAPLQTTWLAGWFTSGVGFTTTVAVMGAPTQVPDVGVMVKVTVIGILVGLVSVPLIFPLPLFAMPVTMGLSLVQA